MSRRSKLRKGHHLGVGKLDYGKAGAGRSAADARVNTADQASRVDAAEVGGIGAEHLLGGGFRSS